MAAEFSEKESDQDIVLAAKPLPGPSLSGSKKTASTVLRVINGGLNDNIEAEEEDDVLERMASKDAGIKEFKDECENLGLDLDPLRNRLSGLADNVFVPGNFHHLLFLYLNHLMNALNQRAAGGSNVTIMHYADFRSAAEAFLSRVPKGKETPVKVKIESLRKKVKQLLGR